MTPAHRNGMVRLAASRAASIFGVVALFACGGDSDKVVKDAASGAATEDAAVQTADPVTSDSTCDGMADGSVCASDMHCLADHCVADRCGDGLVNGREACDDSNPLSGDGCSPVCALEGGQCGDGQVDPGEECDDGNWLDHDVCTNHCLMQRCGNGRLDDVEECDDGNTTDSDGCTSKCLLVGCRNGRIDPGEECDDGNLMDQGDGCTNACKISICGNGKVEKYEDCDDGNKLETDECLNDCTKSGVCGDGVLQRAEACELGDNRVVATSAAGHVSGEHQACAQDCKGWTADDPCIKCQTQHCFLEGIDIESGCFRAVDDEFGADPTDSMFLSQCVQMVACSVKKKCFDPTLPATVPGLSCYCGSISGDQCNTMGPDVEAPCLADWRAAARSDSNADVLGNVSNLSYPITWGFYVLSCYDRTRHGECATECAH